MFLTIMQTHTPTSTADDASMIPYMLFAALVAGAVLLVLGFMAFRWSRPEAVGLPVEQVSHNDGHVDPVATHEAMQEQAERIGRIPARGLVSGRDHIDPPAVGPFDPTPHLPDAPRVPEVRR
ncbi:MAG: hypothetical protein U0174_27105 [Polyangiaceae bacterium]